MTNDEKFKEYGAVTLLQLTAEKYSKKKGIKFEDALRTIAESPIYDGIFDYDGTWLWKEGPDYIMEAKIASIIDYRTTSWFFYRKLKSNFR